MTKETFGLLLIVQIIHLRRRFDNWISAKTAALVEKSAQKDK